VNDLLTFSFTRFITDQVAAPAGVSIPSEEMMHRYLTKYPTLEAFRDELLIVLATYYPGISTFYTGVRTKNV
jgi:hypothetical protein